VNAAASRARRAAPAGALEIVAFDEEQARDAARPRLKTRGLGLSLADRAALALAQPRDLPVLTIDRVSRRLHLPVRIEVIR
jgi:ribonuclease VapC